MVCRMRRKPGRFGISKLRSSIAAVAILAVSPALASLAESRLEGISLAVAEAVFGEPATAESSGCRDRHGDPRDCTATERFRRCLAAAEDSYYQCTDELPWYMEWVCIAALAADTAACTAQAVGEFSPF